MVTEILELLKVAVSKQAALEASLTQGPPRVRANSAHIQQVVMNLVTNASEAIGDRDRVIRVTTDRLAVGSGSNPLEAANNLPESDYVGWRCFVSSP